MSVLSLTEWQTPASNYPNSKHGRARITTSKYRPGFFYECYGLRGYSHFRAVRPLSIKSLKIGRKTWMVDDPPHWWAMEEHARQYSGHVLAGGLGLGLIVHALAANPRVTRITVVEIEQDVIELVGPLVPACEIVHGDFWEYNGKPDGVFFDLFVGDGRELIGDAMRATVLLNEQFPDAAPIRIHGFDNDALAGLGEVVKAGRDGWQELGTRSTAKEREWITSELSTPAKRSRQASSNRPQ